MTHPPARLDEVIDRTLFAAVIERRPKAEPKGLGGRPAFAPAMMLKVSDQQLEFQITDRLSFKRFPGRTGADQSPDFENLLGFPRNADPE